MSLNFTGYRKMPLYVYCSMLIATLKVKEENIEGSAQLIQPMGNFFPTYLNFLNQFIEHIP